MSRPARGREFLVPLLPLKGRKPPPNEDFRYGTRVDSSSGSGSKQTFVGRVGVPGRGRVGPESLQSGLSVDDGEEDCPQRRSRPSTPLSARLVERRNLTIDETLRRDMNDLLWRTGWYYLNTDFVE